MTRPYLTSLMGRLLRVTPRALMLGATWGFLLSLAYTLAYLGFELAGALGRRFSESESIIGLGDTLGLAFAVAIMIGVLPSILVGALSSFLLAAAFSFLRKPPSFRLTLLLALSIASIIATGINVAIYPNLASIPLAYYLMLGIPSIIYLASATPFAMLLSRDLLSSGRGLHPSRPDDSAASLHRQSSRTKIGLGPIELTKAELLIILIAIGVVILFIRLLQMPIDMGFPEIVPNI